MHMKISLACGLMVTTNQSLQLSMSNLVWRIRIINIFMPTITYVARKAQLIQQLAMVGQPRVWILEGARDIFHLQIIQTGCMVYPASYAMDCFPAVRLPGHPVDHTLPSSAEVTAWSYNSTPSVCFHWMYQNILPFLHHA